MRGEAHPQSALVSYLSLQERVPRDHPLRKIRILVDAVLATMNADFAAVYAKRGRPSIPPEFLLRALVIEILYTVRSERQLVEQIDFNLLFRWFVGLSIDDRVWDHSTFSHNRKCLSDEGMARKSFERLKLLAQWQDLVSDEHFRVEGTLIDAWAAHKSFLPKDEQDPPHKGPGRNREVDFKGKKRCNDTADFVATCRRHKVAPHVAAKKSGSAIDARTTRHETYRASIRVRKRIEEIFGWLKTVGGMRKSRHIGRGKLAGQMLLGCAAYNLVRIGSLNGWWDARHT